VSIYQCDHHPDDDPLEEVGNRLAHREPKPDVEVDMVVQHEGADREPPNEATKPGTRA
jgi:hypothetical protein